MMSAKTVTTEAPATQSGNTINLTSAPGSGAPTEFQNLLSGVAPEPTLVDTLPTQPLAQLIASKQLQIAKAAAAAASAGTPVPAQGKQPVATDILKLLTDTATLVPAAGDAATETSEARDEGSLLEERAEDSDDILRDWLDAMVPFGVFAPQAGAEKSATSFEDSAASIGLGGNAKRQTPVSVSLLPQAGSPEREVTDVAAATAVPAALAVSMIGRSVELIATNSQLTAAVVAPTSRSESEGDKPSADGWMSALGDLAAKRGVDVTPEGATRLNTPVHDSRWADAIAHRLVMMAREGESIAQLKLVPQELGPLDIQITVKDSEASVHFGAAHAETRAALESSLPRLRELLSAQGLQLTNASVSQHSGGKNQPERSSEPAAVGARADDGEVSPATAISTSLLDIYA